LIPDVLIPISIIGLLIAVNGLFVTAEFAIIGVRPARVVQLAQDDDPIARRVKQMLDSPQTLDWYLTTTQLGTTAASLALGMYTQHVMASWIVGPIVAWVPVSPTIAHLIALIITISLLITMHTVFGEIIPRSLALHHTERAPLRLYGVVQVASRIFSPFALLIEWVGGGVLWLLNIPKAGMNLRLYSSEELELAVRESYKGGLLSDDEQTIIQNIFDLDERRIGQVMTPRPRIAAIPLDTTEEQLRDYISSSPYSRFPVYEEDIDHIVGLLLVKDVVRQQLEHPGHFDLRSLLRHIPAVPEAMTVDRLLVAFKNSHIHLALVFDEYGSTAGIVTLEDLVEEVVGEVHDEFDQIEQPLWREVQEHVFLARGDLMLDDLPETTPAILREADEEELPDVDTIGGLVVSLLGRPPRPGDHVHMGNALFTVESVSGLAVNLVRIVLDTIEEEDPVLSREDDQETLPPSPPSPGDIPDR
jgi:CBS domain containing-hemolysin-like protein